MMPVLDTQTWLLALAWAAVLLLGGLLGMVTALVVLLNRIVRRAARADKEAARG
jgi:hypothetical protein